MNKYGQETRKVYMFRRLVLDSHLYIGLILSVTILMLSVTGFYLNHQHGWFHKQNVHYLHL